MPIGDPETVLLLWQFTGFCLYTIRPQEGKVVKERQFSS